MTFQEFKNATQKLEHCYNRKMNEMQSEVWFDELKYYDLEKYKKAINRICTTNQYFPALSVMLENLKNTRADVDLTKQKVECKACRGTGIVLYHKIVDGIDYEYACQCNCQNAEGLDYDGTKIADKEHRSPFYLAKAVDVFKVNINAKTPTPTFKVDAIDYDISQINF